MAVAKQRDYKKPLRWFEIGPCFRFERQQRGRLREFYQLNCDMLGEKSDAVDAELVALGIDIMRDLGFTEEHFAVRLSDRNIWKQFMTVENVAPENETALLQIIDKLDREKPDSLDEKLRSIGSSLDAVRAFTGSTAESEAVESVRRNLETRGLGQFVSVDLGIVRGLAYYTGVVFEIFDKQKGMRAVAGGGRYDELGKLIGGSDMAAAGFAMGDVVIGNLIEETGPAKSRLTHYLSNAFSLDAYVVVAAEDRRPEALAIVQQLRDGGLRVEFPLTPAKVGKQFQAAEQRDARAAIVIGDEFPTISVKDLATRREVEAGPDSVLDTARRILDKSAEGMVLAKTQSNPNDSNH